MELDGLEVVGDEEPAEIRPIRILSKLLVQCAFREAVGVHVFAKEHDNGYLLCAI